MIETRTEIMRGIEIEISRKIKSKFIGQVTKEQNIERELMNKEMKREASKEILIEMLKEIIFTKIQIEIIQIENQCCKHQNWKINQM